MPDVPDYNWQDLRVAVVLTGGVSLSVWMSGVVHELNRMVLTAGPYEGLLGLLRAKPRIDVIAGTSAGGINGAFLALAQARRRDLRLLRDVWRSSGDLGALLRDPLRRDPPSLLRGDEYLLVRLADELRALLGPDGEPPGGAAAGPPPEAVELFLTGTLWSGRATGFTDDMGTPITEFDRDATFRFATGASSACGDLDSDGVVDELAAAARSSSSFPGAFEPHWVDVGGSPQVGPDGTPRWASSAGQADFAKSQFLLDGGVLHNKPIRPAIDAIYRQTADLQVRRILAYITPDPAEPELVREPAAGAQPTPSAPDVLLGVLTRLRASDSVARDLAEISARNASVAARRRARAGLAGAMTAQDGALAAVAWPGYVEAREERQALGVARLLAAGQPSGSAQQRWNEAELAAAVRRRRVPVTGSPSAAGGPDWDWDPGTVRRLGDLTLDVLKRAVKLSRLDTGERAEIVACRSGVWTILAANQADAARSEARWTAWAAGSGDDPAGPLPSRTAGSDGLDHWIGALLASRLPDATVDTATLHVHAVGLAGQLRGASGALARIASGAAATRGPLPGAARLAALVDYLLAGAGSDPEVLGRMLRLDVVQLAFAGTDREVEQEVELVQMSSLAPDRLTGTQMHHFGAFYRAHWRVNDWIQGRMDGVVQIMRMLLDPERLRQLSDGSEVRAARDDQAGLLLARLRALAVPDGDPDVGWLAQRWEQSAASVSAELALATPALPDVAGGGAVPAVDPGAVGSRLDATARAIALPAQLVVLREDLAALAAAIRAQGTDCGQKSRAWLADWEAAAGHGATPAAAQLWQLWGSADGIGRERITADAGSDTFARTAATFAAVGVGALGLPRTLGPVKALGVVVSAFRGYVLLLWTLVGLLTRESRFGTRTAQLVLAVGAALVAVAIITPGVPFGFPLAGAFLLLVGFTAAALLTRETWRIGVRLLVVVVVALAAIGGLIAQRILAHELLWSSATVVSALVKAAVVVGVVAMGWWVSGARRR